MGICKLAAVLLSHSYEKWRSVAFQQNFRIPEHCKKHRQESEQAHYNTTLPPSRPAHYINRKIPPDGESKPPPPE
jgi:hypothetical protein